jgi:3-carboxy-cis,cis-muconate cycloisomerase
VGDEAWLQAMLDVEGALARASAHAGVVPAAAAEAIAAACDARRFDVAALGREAAGSATPVVGLVRALREAVGDDAAEHVHRGATSQDVLDTAAMLVARRALEPLLADAAAAASAAGALAAAHRDTPMTGRTLLQQAVPITFGLKAAGWMTAIDAACVALAAVPLAAQLGGAAGTRAGLDGRGADVAYALAGALGLDAPVLPWHGDRTRPARLAGALAVLAGALAKPARDVVLLAQQEVGEVREGGEGRGASSAMPHKRNPVAAVSVIACAERVPGLAATVHAAMAGEHERAAGRWQAEWETLGDLLRLTGSAAAWCRDLLEGLEVDPERMRANLEAAPGGADADLGEAPALVDSALAAHEDARA